MSDNIIPFGAKRNKTATPGIGRGPDKPEGFVPMDQDEDFNVRLENSTTATVLDLDTYQDIDAIKEAVLAVMTQWRQGTFTAPQFLDIVTIKASVAFPGEENKPTVALFNFDHRVRTALVAAFGDGSDEDQLRNLVDTLSSFMMTMRMWMFVGADQGNMKLAYGGTVGISVDVSYYGVGITLMVNGSAQANTFFARHFTRAV